MSRRRGARTTVRCLCACLAILVTVLVAWAKGDGDKLIGVSPILVAVTPSAGNPGKTLVVTIRGTGFQDGATASFGDGIAVSSTRVISATEVQADLTIAPDAALGRRSVTVANPGGFPGVFPDSFEVVALPSPFDEKCVVAILNRVAQVRPDGTWALQNVPTNFGPLRARATCVIDGVTHSGQSNLFTVPQNGSVTVGEVRFDVPEPIPAALRITAPTTTLTAAGATLPLTVTAVFGDGSTRDVTADPSTSFLTSNAAVADVSASGEVTAGASGLAVITVLREGVSAFTRITVSLASADSDGDGIPDDLELANGLDPNDPVDAEEDPDRDGLTNRQELIDYGTKPRVADTDGDGISDGNEVFGKLGYRTSPVLADTDGDGVRDLLEIQTGSNPLDPNSLNLAAALTAIEATPSVFAIVFNTIAGEASRQLAVAGHLRDGTTIDLTSTRRGTNYASSDLGVCNFGAESGRVFAGQSGDCTITVSNSGLTDTSVGTVRTFAPTALGFVDIPGFANNVDVNGGFAFVAAGSAGLQVVDLSDHASPRIVGSVDTPGNANDVKVVGTRAYVADGSAGLRIFDVTDPASPRFLGSVDTPGDAWDLSVAGTRVLIADGPSGVQVVEAADPSSPTVVGSIGTPGIAKGVDVARDFAVVADGSAGLRIIDISNPDAPRELGAVDTPGDARDVVVDGTTAFVADFGGSLEIVDFSDPRAPSILAATDPSLGGLLVDLAFSDRFVLGADVFFVNGVPIIDVGQPAAPIPRARLDFAARDDNGTGIAADGNFVYLTAEAGSITENGTVGTTRLYIGQYLALEDLGGIAPTVTLTAPAAGDIFVTGENVTIRAAATDDVSVTAVEFLVDGVPVFTDTSAPYEFVLRAPAGVSSLTLAARAFDLGGNIGVASDVVVNVIPDPLTTVVGTVVDPDGRPVAGATVTALGLSGLSAANGSFSIPGVPTITGLLRATASFTTPAGTRLVGVSAAVRTVRGGTTDVGVITLASCVPAPSGLIAWWPADGNANDLVGGNHGALQGGAGFAPGRVGEALLFNGVDGFVKVRDSDRWAFGANDFTIDLWANFSSLRSSTIGNPAVVFIGDDEGSGGTNKWFFALGGGVLNFHINGPALGPRFLAQTPFSPLLNHWYHLAVTRNGGTYAIYVDGTPGSSESSTDAIPNPDAPLTIGQAEGLGFMDGLIDEVEIYDRALSRSEIEAILRAGSAGKCKPPPTFDASHDYALIANPNGPWSYGASRALGSITLYATADLPIPGFERWHLAPGIPESLGAPVVVHNGTDHTISVVGIDIPPGQVVFHPGGGGEFSVIRFTAPSAGSYDVSVAFTGADLGSTDVHVLRGSQEIFTGILAGRPDRKTFSTRLSLSAGEAIDFAVGPNGGFFYDTTFIDATIATVTPAPASPALVGGDNP